MGSIYLGNFIEFLEFVLFASLLPFFSQDILHAYDPHVRAHLSYLLLYIGFLGRPIGAYYLGKMGDHYGPKYLLIFSVLGISMTTFLIPFVLYLAAPLIPLMIIRFFQGLFTGAEQTAATVYVYQKLERGYLPMSFLIASGIAGVVVSHGWVYSLSLSGMEKSLWPYSFWIVSLLGLMTFWNRIKNKPTIKLKEIFTHKKESLKPYTLRIFTGIIVFGFTNAMFYFIGLFINQYKMILSGYTQASSFLLNILSSLSFCVFIIGWGWIFRKKTTPPSLNIILFAFLCLSLILPFVFYTYIEDSSFGLKMTSQILYVAFTQIITLVGNFYISHQFPSSIRVQATGLCMGVGSGLLGGGYTAPLRQEH